MKTARKFGVATFLAATLVALSLRILSWASEPDRKTKESVVRSLTSVGRHTVGELSQAIVGICVLPTPSSQPSAIDEPWRSALNKVTIPWTQTWFRTIAWDWYWTMVLLETDGGVKVLKVDSSKLALRIADVENCFDSKANFSVTQRPIAGAAEFLVQFSK